MYSYLAADPAGPHFWNQGESSDEILLKFISILQTILMSEIRLNAASEIRLKYTYILRFCRSLFFHLTDEIRLIQGMKSG